MFENMPILDKRDKDISLINNLLLEYLKNTVNCNSDDLAANMLCNVFSRLMQIALERLNRVPEKYIFTFLESIGVGILPQSAALVPLTFEAANDSKGILVPKGTLVGTKSDNQNNSITFETVEDLYVLPIKISFLYTIDPVWNRFTDHLSNSNPGKTCFSPFIGRENLFPSEAEQLFEDIDPAFYIGFDRIFTELPITLYIETMPGVSNSSIKYSSIPMKHPSFIENDTMFIWEYFNGIRWTTISVIDETDNFSCSGTIKFILPYDIAFIDKFKKPCYLIRVRIKSSNKYWSLYYHDQHLIKGIYLNSVAALNRISTVEEIIGSSNGQGNQRFNISSMNILDKQQIWIREPERPSENEYLTIIAEEGSDVLRFTVNDYTKEQEVWVRWHEVPNFFASAANSRHYTIDCQGAITFGDGVNGMIPPKEINNIKAAYSSGGGLMGNVEEKSVCLIKSSLPGITSVYNPVAAQGGADIETAREVMERGPQRVRNGERAVTSSDYEWTAKQAAGTKIGKIKCFPNINREMFFKTGSVTLVLVPQGIGKKLLPSKLLIRELKNKMRDAVTPLLLAEGFDHLNIMGPGYIGVSVDVDIVPKRVEDAQSVKKQSIEALNTFFHPLKGGVNCKGWDFGRNVFKIELASFLKGIPGVDHVIIDSIKIKSNTIQQRLYISKDRYTEFAFEQYSKVTLKYDKRPENPETKSGILESTNIMASCGMNLQTEEDLTLDIKIFNEGDLITASIDLKVISMDDGKFKCNVLQDYKLRFPAGCMIRDKAGEDFSFLKECTEIKQDGTIEISLCDNILQVEKDKISEWTLYFPIPLMKINSISILNNNTYRLEIDRCIALYDLPKNMIITTLDNTLRLPLAQSISKEQNITHIDVKGFSKDDPIFINNRSYYIRDVEPIYDIAYIDDNYLIYPGVQSVNIVST